jgi:NhaP-type Na+/H+ or K+/H+ antiporter
MKMEEYVMYLFYLAVLLILGVFITSICHNFKLSNVLFLVLTGYLLKFFNLDFFNNNLIIVLSALALIMIILETTMRLDLVHILTNFLSVLKFNIAYLILSTYIMTLGIYQFFNIPGNNFDAFILCLLLSLIIYGIDPFVTMEFFHSKKSRVSEMLEIEGFISGPIVVIFSFFIINYMNTTLTLTTSDVIAPLLIISKQIVFAIIIGMVLAYILYKFIMNFKMLKELQALMIIAIGIAVFVLGEFFGANGSLATAIYGLFLRGLTKQRMPKETTSLIAHILFIIVFILFGIEFFFPSLIFWIKGLVLFMIYLLLRFACIFLFIKDITFKEKLYITFNVAKGIEIALVMFIMKLNFSNLEGLTLILGIGYMFFIFSYVLSTTINHFNKYFITTD